MSMCFDLLMIQCSITRATLLFPLTLEASAAVIAMRGKSMHRESPAY